MGLDQTVGVFYTQPPLCLVFRKVCETTFGNYDKITLRNNLKPKLSRIEVKFLEKLFLSGFLEKIYFTL